MSAIGCPSSASRTPPPTNRATILSLPAPPAARRPPAPAATAAVRCGTRRPCACQPLPPAALRPSSTAALRPDVGPGGRLSRATGQAAKAQAACRRDDGDRRNAASPARRRRTPAAPPRTAGRRSASGTPPRPARTAPGRSGRGRPQLAVAMHDPRDDGDNRGARHAAGADDIVRQRATHHHDRQRRIEPIVSSSTWHRSARPAGVTGTGRPRPSAWSRLGVGGLRPRDRRRRIPGPTAKAGGVVAGSPPTSGSGRADPPGRHPAPVSARARSRGAGRAG